MKPGFIASVFAVLCVIVTQYTMTAAYPAERTHVPMHGAPTVSGTVTYRERIALPGMAMVHITLVDVSGKEPLAAKLGEQTIWVAEGRLPVTFRIPYDPSRIDPGHVYIVQARIMEEKKLLFINTTPYYVLTRGAPSTVDIIVTPVR